MEHRCLGGSRLAAELTPDVEALLVRRGDGAECHLVPIDACYELVGPGAAAVARLRRRPEAWQAIDAFFDELRERARDARPPC